MTKKFYDIILDGKGGGGSDPVPDSTNLDNWIGWLRKRVSIQNHEVDYLKLAMSEFAQQEAIAFAEWWFRSGYSPCACTFGIGWLHKDDGQKPFIEAKFYTTIELYSLFKTQNNG